MTSLAWTRAAALLKLPRAAGWPATLEPMQAAALQEGFTTAAERREAHLLAATLADACRAGEIASEAATRPVRPRSRRIVGAIGGAPMPPQTAPPARAVEVFRVGAAAFADWLRAQGLEPAPLVAAWLAAHGAKPAEQPGKLWTATRIAEARSMRDKLKAEGARDYHARTAKAFGVNGARLRQVLGPDESRPKLPALVGWPAPAKRIHRLK
jgi:hypothetical protein